MAFLSATALLYATAALIIYHVVSSYLTHRQLQRFAKTNNASFAKHVPTKLPFGIDFVWRTVSTVSNGGDLLDDVYGPLYAANGTTFSMPSIGSTAEMFTIDPANIQAILATKFQDFPIGEKRNSAFRLLLGDSILTTDGAFWEHSRALFRPQFSREQISDLGKTEASVQALFEALPLVGTEHNGSVEVDIMPIIFRFTLDTSTDFLFGESVDSQRTAAVGVTSMTSATAAMAADQGSNEMTFAEAFHEAPLWILTRVRLQGLYWLAPSKKGKKAAEYLRRYTDHYVRLAKAEVGKDKHGLLNTLVEQTRDEVELRDQILAMLVAGRDTTATLLSWVILLLAQHPEAFRRLRQEVIRDFGEYTTDPWNINFSTLKACKYLQFVLRETLRVYDSVPINARVAARDTVLPRGGGADGSLPIVVQKGQTVNFVPYLLHRREDMWDAATEFRPERWEGVKLDWTYIPFSGGPRICLGQQFALTEAGYLLARLTQKFERIDWLGPPGKPKKDVLFTLSPRDGVHIRLHYAHS
ncbi:hypothetical protein KVR01_012868 [Diaporthe batatas]|uniref:uncharacterized protein n=1 Tax=Diaporthe batatas TaxID=748121 RepID=UPI001D0433FD|nr:uncharacterized protein KVR01_012868 [Diaporthe batatas]KAG8157160.1 hypothetical protein KVR01_012868 [Diaporthe batatas]